MLRNRFFLIGLFLIVLAVIYYSFFASGNTTTPIDELNPQTYRQQVAEERKKKDEFFRTSSESPFTDKSTFSGLTYFEPDPQYRVTARLEPFADKTQKLVIPLTDGNEEVYDKYAHAVFSLKGEPCHVLLLKHENTISLLFKDHTNGKGTYGGGRYIDIDPNAIQENRIVIDFNAAYNPYCAYNHEYACPLPPKENTLPVAVEAGEKYRERP